MTDPIPRRTGFGQTLGAANLTALMLLALTGLGLAFHYVPVPALAYDSIRSIEQDHSFGISLRSMHYYGAILIVALVLVAMLRTFLGGAYKGPHRFTWVSGVLMMLVVITIGVTGELLPWTEQAFFATDVRAAVMAASPGIGDTLREVALGGDEVSSPTLLRFYVLHVVILPAVLIGLIVWHLRRLKRFGLSAPGQRLDAELAEGKPWFPNHLLKQALVALATAAAIFAMGFYWRAPLGSMAEAGTPFDAWPEWHMLWLNKLLKLVPGEWMSLPAFWIPAALVGGALLLPFVDRNPERHWRKRPYVLSLGLGVLAILVGLSVANTFDKPETKDAMPYPLGLTDAERQGYLLVRRHACLECHLYEGQYAAGKSYGEAAEDAPNLEESVQETAEEFIEILVDPPGEMTAYDDVPHEDLRRMSLFLLKIQEL